jgi:hypothetical protein
MKTLLAWILGVGVLTTLSACDDGGGTCANAAACGGDIVGSWKITSSCISFDASSMVPNMGCPGLTSRASGFQVTGSGTYAADMTYTGTTTLTGNVVVTVPASCLMQQGITLTCAQLQQALQADMDTTEFSSVTCAGSGGCSCTMVMVPQTSSGSGTYTTTGAGLLTEMETGGDTSQSDYCVKGTTLTVSPRAMPGMTGVSGTITLTKQ